MFYLNNKAIQYPFAEVERVPVCKVPVCVESVLLIRSDVHRLRRCHPLCDPLRLGCDVPPRIA